MSRSLSSNGSTSKEPSRVRVYDAEAIGQMLTRDENFARPSQQQQQQQRPYALREASAKADKKRLAREAEEARQRRYERHREEASKRQEDAVRAVRERVVETQQKRERRFNDLVSDIDAGRKLSSEIDKHLSLHEMNSRNKQKKLFDEWNEQVYGNIQDQIATQLETRTTEEISRKRRGEFQKFLNATNSKGAIFRDIIIESEYDPLEPNRHCIKVDPAKIRDPVKRVLDRHYEETTTLSDKAKGRPKAHSREMLDTRVWGSGKIEATPHGYFAKMMMTKDDKPDAPVDNSLSRTYASKVPFDHFNVAKGPKVTDSEFPIGKRTSPFQKSTIFSA